MGRTRSRSPKYLHQHQTNQTALTFLHSNSWFEWICTLWEQTICDNTFIQSNASNMPFHIHVVPIFPTTVTSWKKGWIVWSQFDSFYINMQEVLLTSFCLLLMTITTYNILTSSVNCTGDGLPSEHWEHFLHVHFCYKPYFQNTMDPCEHSYNWL